MCSKGDACSFRHDDSWRGKKTQSSSLAPRSKAQNVERRSLKGSALSSSEANLKQRVEITLKETVRSRRVLIVIFTVCHNYKLESGCAFGGKCVFRHTEVGSEPSKKKKSGEKDLLSYNRIRSIWVAYSRIQSLRNPS